MCETAVEICVTASHGCSGMEMDMKFTKMQGCGNDYVYIDGSREQIPQEEKPELVRRLSDRPFGMG